MKVQAREETRMSPHVVISGSADYVYSISVLLLFSTPPLSVCEHSIMGKGRISYLMNLHYTSGDRYMCVKSECNLIYPTLPKPSKVNNVWLNVWRNSELLLTQSL